MIVPPYTLLLSLVFVLSTTFLSSGQNLDSLKQKVQAEKSQEEKILLLKRLGEGLQAQRKIEAIQYFDELLSLGKARNDKFLQAYALNKTGVSWYYENDLKKSSQYYFQALEFTEESTMFFDIKSRIYNNLGWNFKMLGDLEKSLHHFIRAEGYARQSGNEEALALVLNNKGVAEKDLGKYDNAMVSLNESLGLNRKVGNKRQERFNLNNLCVLQIQVGQYRDAVESLQKLLAVNTQLKDSVEMVNNLINLGTAYTGAADFTDAKTSLLSAIDLSERLRFIELKWKATVQLSNMAKAKGDYEEAYVYSVRSFKLADSLKNLEQHRYSVELEARYNSLVKDKDLEEARKELAEQRFYLTLILSALVLAIIVVFFFGRTIRIKRKSEQKLLALNSEIEHKAGELQEANAEILTINDNLEKLIEQRTEVIRDQNSKLREFAFMNSHKLRGPVASILGIVYLLKDSRNDHMRLELMQHLSSCITDLVRVIHDVNRQLEQDKSMEQPLGAVD
jgi:tetratricopeptide (TPR) repeat protein